jgi:hypothetical protein
MSLSMLIPYQVCKFVSHSSLLARELPTEISVGGQLYKEIFFSICLDLLKLLHNHCNWTEKKKKRGGEKIKGKLGEEN